ncbi:MAG: ribonuclease HII [Candidatus Delongbacteria bacterium]|nr:ribonuclease HII [Candidatus Delongbacteria bacterium]MCG2760690.1 ribonuclease HII [Candidatus Delongbacteria bacterium]
MDNNFVGSGHLFKYETELYLRGYKLIAGVDEAGRGPLAGPVVAAAVIFKQGVVIDGVDDSKKLSGKNRERLFYEIRKNAISYGVGMISNKRIDEINILRATFEAMKRAVERLSVKPDYILIDGRDEPFETNEQMSIIKGDSLSYSVAAASIIAKVTRDKIMNFYDKIYPNYGFNHNKGYATAGHIEAIKALGRCDIHRKSFRLQFEKNPQMHLEL